MTRVASDRRFHRRSAMRVRGEEAARSSRHFAARKRDKRDENVERDQKQNLYARDRSSARRHTRQRVVKNGERGVQKSCRFDTVKADRRILKKMANHLAFRVENSKSWLEKLANALDKK